MSVKKMTPADASRIQSHADKSGTNQDFKARAQSSASKSPAPAPAPAPQPPATPKK